MNITVSPTRRRSNLNAAVDHAANHDLPATLLRMLSEAPGFAHDIASSLDISRQTVERDLSALVRQGFAVRVRDAEGIWFRLTNHRMADAVLTMSDDADT